MDIEMGVESSLIHRPFNKLVAGLTLEPVSSPGTFLARFTVVDIHFLLWKTPKVSPSERPLLTNNIYTTIPMGTFCHLSHYCSCYYWAGQLMTIPCPRNLHIALSSTTNTGHQGRKLPRTVPTWFLHVLWPKCAVSLAIESHHQVLVDNQVQWQLPALFGRSLRHSWSSTLGRHPTMHWAFYFVIYDCWEKHHTLPCSDETLVWKMNFIKQWVSHGLFWTSSVVVIPPQSPPLPFPPTPLPT